MSVRKYLEKNFYPWAKIELVNKEDKKILYVGNVGDCKQYLENKVIAKPINCFQDVSRIEIIV